MNYYEEIKDLIEKKEVKDGVRRLSYNSDKLKTYYEIGKLLVEAQGGEKKTRYGDMLIKKWSKKLMKDYGKGYSITNLKNMRKFYIIQKGQPLVDRLTWTNWTLLFPIKNENERNYYINQCILNNLSKRELAKLIKEKAYDRLSYADKNNIKIINFKNEASYSLKDMLLDPIIIKLPKNENISEKILKKYILDELRDFFLQLGSGFLYAGSEYKLEVGGKEYFIDLLFYHLKLKCYIVVELKAREFEPTDAGQLNFYLSAVDDLVKDKDDNATIGLLLCKGKDNFTAEYALKDIKKPIGVSEYKLLEDMPEYLQSQLPRAEDIELRIKDIEKIENDED